MADWIKIEKHTPDKPEVAAIASSCGLEDADAALGKLLRVWMWADSNVDGCYAPSVTEKIIDRITCCPGFSKAMKEAGWLHEDEDGVVFPNFERHNGKSAKNRAQSILRMQKARGIGYDESVTKAQQERNGRDGDSVTKASPDKIRIYTPPIVPPKGEKRTSKKAKTFTPPSVEEVFDYASERGVEDPRAATDKFFDFFTAGNWKDSNGKQVSNWKQKFVTWQSHGSFSEFRQNNNRGSDGVDWSKVRMLTDEDFADAKEAGV